MSTTRPVSDPQPPAHTAATHASEAPKLSGDLGVVELLFTVLAFNGPLAVVVGFATVVIGYGNGIGAPMAYIGAALLVALFAAGFMKMSHRVQNPGGFYSFITTGLGREVGLGASFLALVSYYLLLLGCYAFGGIALNSLVAGTLGGPDIAWWVWALVLQLIVAVLGYFRLDLSAKILTVLLAGEVVIILVYDAFVVAQGGAHGLTGASFLPSNIFSGAVGLALLFGMLCMGGFEATVVFRDEVRDPDRTIPRATYGFIAAVALLYGLTTWVIVEALGEDKAASTAAADPTGSFLQTMHTYVGVAGVDLVTVLLNTSILAATIATHNVLTRYVFNLAVDGILPRGVGKVHGIHGSPHRSSIVTSVAVLLGLTPFVIFGAEPALLYAQLSGGFGYSLILLLVITSVAVMVYLTRHKLPGVSVWHSVIAPGLAAIGLAITLYLATSNIELLITAGGGIVAALLSVVYGVIAVGIVMALVLKRKRPEVYARIGRQ